MDGGGELLAPPPRTGSGKIVDYCLIISGFKIWTITTSQTFSGHVSDISHNKGSTPCHAFRNLLS